MNKKIFYKISDELVCQVDIPKDINIEVNNEIKNNIKNYLAKLLNVAPHLIEETTKKDFDKIRI